MKRAEKEFKDFTIDFDLWFRTQEKGYTIKYTDLILYYLKRFAVSEYKMNDFINRFYVDNEALEFDGVMYVKLIDKAVGTSSPQINTVRRVMK